MAWVWVYKLLILWYLSASPRKYCSNTKEIEGDLPRQVRVPITTLYWSDYAPKDSIPRVWDREASGGARRPRLVPLGREQLKAHFALFRAREIQNIAHTC